MDTGQRLRLFVSFVVIMYRSIRGVHNFEIFGCIYKNNAHQRECTASGMHKGSISNSSNYRELHGAVLLHCKYAQSIGKIHTCLVCKSTLFRKFSKVPGLSVRFERKATCSVTNCGSCNNPTSVYVWRVSVHSICQKTLELVSHFYELLSEDGWVFSPNITSCCCGNVEVHR